MRHLMHLAGAALLVWGLFFPSCTSKLMTAQNYPQTPVLEDKQKEELLLALSRAFPQITQANIDQELQSYVLVKGNSHPTPQFIRFDDQLRMNIRMGKLDFVPYWKLKNHPGVDILYMEGYGYAGPIWGYLIFDEKKGKALDVYFFHRKETRSYGADLSADWYQEQYAGLQLFADSQLFLMENPQREVYTVGGTRIDGLSGSTVTNNGVRAMFNALLKNYEALVVTGTPD
jgi:Na(+)-translocating NADH:ubiquinone oxidoreductase C subunit